jgi:cobalt/nickel transport protein
MNSSLKNGLLLTAVVLLTLLPLMTIKTPVAGPDGEQAAIFTGTDNQAEGVIQKLHPDYQPWFNSLLKPPSGEIESLLFALQAALGAAVIGYYAGYVRGKSAGSPPGNVTDRAH